MGTEQEFRCAIVLRDHLLCHAFALVDLFGASQAEITDLDTSNSVKDEFFVSTGFTLSRQSLFTSRLPGFRSRWITPAEWRNFRPTETPSSTCTATGQCSPTSKYLVKEDFTVIYGECLL